MTTINEWLKSSSHFLVFKIGLQKNYGKKKSTCTAVLFVTMVIETDAISIVTEHYLSPCEIEGTMPNQTLGRCLHLSPQSALRLLQFHSEGAVATVCMVRTRASELLSYLLKATKGAKKHLCPSSHVILSGFKVPFLSTPRSQTMMLQKSRVAFLNCPSRTRRAETPVSLDCKGPSAAMEGIYSTWSG